MFARTTNKISANLCTSSKLLAFNPRPLVNLVFYEFEGGRNMHLLQPHGWLRIRIFKSKFWGKDSFPNLER